MGSLCEGGSRTDLEELHAMEHTSFEEHMDDSKPRKRNRVRELRENKLMTQAQLAKKAKVALRTIHSVEKGMNCRMDTKRKILLALGMRFEDKDQVFLD
jgi:DNA-binding XRE family transcriptional regulator